MSDLISRQDVPDINVGDMISRQDAINTSLEFFVEYLGGAFDENSQKELMVRLQRLSSAEPEYKELQDWKTDFKNFVEWLDIPRDDYKGIMEYIDEVPSAEPRKKGKWIYGTAEQIWEKVEE